MRFDWCIVSGQTGREVYYAGAPRLGYSPTDAISIGTAKLNDRLVESLLADEDSWAQDTNSNN